MVVVEPTLWGTLNLLYARKPGGLGLYERAWDALPASPQANLLLSHPGLAAGLSGITADPE